MAIQFLLTTIIGVLILYSIYHGKRLFPWKFIFVSTLLIGLILVWNPDSTTSIANRVGIGRGADLLLYLLIIANLMIVINMHNKFHELTQIITKLTRKLALLEQNQEQDAQASEKSERTPDAGGH